MVTAAVWARHSSRSFSWTLFSSSFNRLWRLILIFTASQWFIQWLQYYFIPLSWLVYLATFYISWLSVEFNTKHSFRYYDDSGFYLTLIRISLIDGRYVSGFTSKIVGAPIMKVLEVEDPNAEDLKGRSEALRRQEVQKQDKAKHGNELQRQSGGHSRESKRRYWQLTNIHNTEALTRRRCEQVKTRPTSQHTKKQSHKTSQETGEWNTERQKGDQHRQFRVWPRGHADHWDSSGVSLEDRRGSDIRSEVWDELRSFFHVCIRNTKKWTRIENFFRKKYLISRCFSWLNKGQIKWNHSGDELHVLLPQDLNVLQSWADHQLLCILKLPTAECCPAIKALPIITPKTDQYKRMKIMNGKSKFNKQDVMGPSVHK